VEALTVRLLPDSVADGARHMAADQVLLEAAAEGVASLRFYRWQEATVSLGYFQPERVRFEDERLAGLPWVRRPSGGATLMHHHEITYALGLPAGRPWHSDTPWLRRMHQVLAAALADLGVTAQLAADGETPPLPQTVLCFRQLTSGDLTVGGAKIVGSAQRRHRGALMQHGAVLLAQSPFTPQLPGILELTGRRLTFADVRAATVGAFTGHTGWDMEVSSGWTDAEGRRIGELAAEKYGGDAWNRKR
jgi:lipoate-protein ligase A